MNEGCYGEQYPQTTENKHFANTKRHTVDVTDHTYTYVCTYYHHTGVSATYIHSSFKCANKLHWLWCCSPSACSFTRYDIN